VCGERRLSDTHAFLSAFRAEHGVAGGIQDRGKDREDLLVVVSG
jgi:hypothetical protein